MKRFLFLIAGSFFTGFLFAGASLVPGKQDTIVTLNWLDGTPPGTNANVTWGVPWARGSLQRETKLRLVAADGHRVEMQTWPLAFWPDGSVKWTGHAVAAAAGLTGPFKLMPVTGAEDERSTAREIKYAQDASGISIDTGAVRARIARQGDAFVESLMVGERVVASSGRLIARREDRAEYATKRILREEEFTSRIERVTLEQSGPVRAVVKVEGRHRSADGKREWLPFVVRLYFYAGSAEIRLVHTFIFDGDDQRDFIKGIGLAFSIPFREELHNRHMRFVGDGSGVWAQPIQMVPGYRVRNLQEATGFYEGHLAGQRVPARDALPPQVRRALETMPVWGDAKLTQLGSEGFTISKRTTEASSWLRVTEGRRARGLAFLGDVTGGLAVGSRIFGKSIRLPWRFRMAVNLSVNCVFGSGRRIMLRWICGITTRCRTG